MKPIPKQRKEAILAKMSAPDCKPLSAIAAEEGISITTRNLAAFDFELLAP